MQNFGCHAVKGLMNMPCQTMELLNVTQNLKKKFTVVTCLKLLPSVLFLSSGTVKLLLLTDSLCHASNPNGQCQADAGSQLIKGNLRDLI